MADPGTVATDIQVAEIEKELKAVYNKAYKDILQKQKDFQAKHQAKDAIYQKKLADGEITKEQYQAWLKGQVFQGDQWQAKKKQILDTIYHTNEIATQIVNGKMSGVFAGNANYMAYSLEKSVGVSFGFGLYDSATVVNLIKNNPTLLPPKKLDPVKDKAWNNKKINRAIALGIVEGESLDKIATRLADVTSSANFNSMRTMARTAMTGAQNAGREFRLKEAVDLGIGVKKEWLATLDEVTRLMHRELDGQKQDLDKPFEVGGLKIRYPGDPTAKGMLVYNCRCTMVGDIDEYPATYNRYDNIDGKPIQGMTYKEWEEAKKSGKDIAPKALTFSHKEPITSPIGLVYSKFDYDLASFLDGLDASDQAKLVSLLENFEEDDIQTAWEKLIDGLYDFEGDDDYYAENYKDLNDLLSKISKKKGWVETEAEDETSTTVKGLFKDKKMTAVYKEMKALDSKEAFQFYTELKGMGKPSEVWQQYLDGTLDPEQAKKITEYLKKYADKAGLIPKEIDFTKEFAGKKMSNVYNEMKGVDKATANKFYKELQAVGKPSEVWQAYLDGTLDPETTKKLNALLKAHTDALAKKTTKVEKDITVKSLFEKYEDPFDMPDDLTMTVFNVAYDNKYGPGWNVFWEKYLDGTLDPDLQKKLEDALEKYAKKKGLISGSDKITKPEAPKKKKSSGDPLKDAQDELKAVQDEITSVGADKVFKGIWKDDVTYADYDAKKGGIAAKKSWYKSEIDKCIANGWTAKAQKLSNYLAELEEFEKNGEEYSKLLKKLNAAKSKVKQLTPAPKIDVTGKAFDESNYTEEAKKKAHTFSDRRSADKFHRKYLDTVWDELSDEEKYAIWEYTRNSNPMNKSLSGYHDSWSRSNFVGMDKAVWGHEDSWRSLPANFKRFGKGGHCTYHKAISDATKAIDKCALPEAVTLVRGSDKAGLAGMIEGKVFSFEAAKKILDGKLEDIQAALEGQIVQNHAFTSTGIATGTGFGGSVAYRILAPKGTHAVYAEPQSYFGDTVGSSAKLYKKGQSYSGVGYEAEVILQRGTEFRITKIEQEGGTLVVYMEVVAQPDYFEYGDEDTFNAGKTRHKS